MIKIDLENEKVILEKDDSTTTYALGSREAFNLISSAWLRSGWDTKYVYSFSWLGRPIIQLPEDMFRIQETIYTVKPDVIIETGVAHGGSLIFYASLCKAMEKGRVIGVDIEIREHNRHAIEAHNLFNYISLIEGSSTDPSVVEDVKSKINPGETVLVILDSNHTKQHVYDELFMYSKFVSTGSYIVACDGIMANLDGAPRSSDDWTWNNPLSAINDFIKENYNFVLDEPEFIFNEGIIQDRVTYWPNAFLKRIK